jgi:alanine racemase
LDANALEANYRHLVSLAGSHTEVAAVVKADAYGHGLASAAAILQRAGCQTFCIATTAEAVRLREVVGPQVRIMKLIPSLPEEYEEILHQAVEQVVVSGEDCRAWEQWLAGRNATLRFHLKIDCGMGRLGFTYPEFQREAPSLAHSPHLLWTGFMSQLPASAEEPMNSAEPGDPQGTHTSSEIKRFQAFAEEAERLADHPLEKHIANSGGLLFHPQSHIDLVRAGLALYGADPRGMDGTARGLLPALSVHSRLVQIRTFSEGATIGYGRTFTVRSPAQVGVAPAGYADGFFRKVAEKGFVLVQGRRCKILGRISMNLISIDLSSVESPQVGDPVTLLGRDGQERISVEELAGWAETIPYEVLTSMGSLSARGLTGQHGVALA